MFRVLRGFRLLGRLVAFVIALQALPVGVAQAGLVGTEAVISGESADQRAKVRTFIARDEVRAALVQQGVDPGEAAERIAAMSGAEIALLAAHIEDEPAGQGLLGIVVLAGLVALIVILVADLSGESDIF